MSKYEELHIEQDFWNDFIVEAFEHIDEIQNNAMSLEQHPEDMDIIHTMFRAFHTIKGLSGFVEHTIIQEIAHKTETMMDYCRKGEIKVSTKIVDAILKSSDYIKQLCNDIESYKDESLIENIEKLLIALEELSNVENMFETLIESQTEEVQADFIQNSENQQEIIQEEAISEFEQQQEFNPEPEQQMNFEEEVIQEDIGQEEFNQEIIQQEEGTQEEIIQEDISSENEFQASFDTQIQEEPVSNEEGLQAFAEEAFEIKEEKIIEEDKQTNQDWLFAGTQQETENELNEAKNKAEEKEPTVEDLALKELQKNIMAKLKGEDKFSKTESSKDTSAAKATSASEEYMKVANHKIDHLVDIISELIINQSLIEQYVFSKYSEDRQLTTNMSGFLRITRELQSLSMSLRMVSLKSTFQKLARIARDTINELNKEVDFVMTGEGTEIDRVVTEKLLDPLVHMIKNAISHGIEENPDDRVNKGKNRKGKVELSAYSKRGKIFIEVKDDGRGIDTEVVYQKALEKGLIDPARTYSEAEIKEFIMLPGFSTAKVVDNISGRGVGMDVVKTQILKTGGKVDIQSTLNEGSKFVLEVPVNHAIMNGTIIEMNEQQFVVPTVNVKEFLQPTQDQWIFTRQERTMIRVRDNIIPIVPVSVFFEGAKEEKDVSLVMILELDQELRAVPIKNVINRQEVVVKPVGEEFSHLKYISGMSILGTGKVSLILDIDYLFRKEVKNNG